MENSNGEPQSFFEAPVTTPERSHYDRFTRRDEKIADINATLASKTRIIPEQQRLIMENALTKHWVPLSDKDSRRFGPPTPETERQFEKAVAAEVTRERELLRKQGFSEDQIAGKMSEREQQARVRLARDKKEFFTIRDKPYEAPKPKTNQELLSEARAAYDEAEKQFKTKLNSLLDDANEKTNGQARAAKIQLEKARKHLIHAFTGEDDPELVKKYTELLQRSATRDEAEAKIFRYKQENPRQEERDPRSFFTPDEPIERPKRPQPRVFTPQEEASMRPLFEEETDDDDGLDGVNDRLKGLTEKFPDTALTDETIDQFIQAHLIDPSGLGTAFEDYKKDPSDQNKEALLRITGEIQEQHQELDNLLKQTRFRESQELTRPFKQGIDYSKGSEKYKGFKDFNQDIKTLITYSREITGLEKSTERPDLYGNDLYRDEVFIDMYVDWMRAKGVAPEEYKSPADAIRIFYTRAELEADQLARKKAAGIVEKKIQPPPTTFDTAKEVLVLEGNEVDQFVTDHFVDVSPLLTEYQTYRDALNVLTALKQARKKGNQSITDDQVAEAEYSAKQIVQRFEPIVEDIDEQLSEKGIDKSVTLQARRESPGVRDAQKLMTILSYQKQVSDLINLVEEATGKKTARNGNAIRRSDDEVQELFSNINENLSRIRSIQRGEQEPSSSETEATITQENNQENLTVLQPENAVTLPPESVALKDTVHSITQKINIIGAKLFVSTKEGAKNEIKPEIDELTALIETLNAIENPPVPVDYLIDQVEEFINFLQNAPAENSLVAQIDYLESKDYLTSAKNHVLRKEYEKEIEMAITQSTPEEKRTVPMSVADFSIYAQDLLLAYTKNVTSRYFYSRNPDVFDQNNLDLRRSNLTTLFNTVFVTDDIADSDDDFHQMAHSYVTAVKGLFRLVSEKQNDAELFSDPVKKREFLTQVEEQKRRVESFIF